MSKCEVMDRKQTQWLGLWYHPEYRGYSSQVINLGALKKFKGGVRFLVYKNRYYEKGSDRPNYVFSLKDANAEQFVDIEVRESPDKYEKGYRACIKSIAKIIEETGARESAAEAILDFVNNYYSGQCIEEEVWD